MKVHGVLLSAGESDRFKGDKLFTEVKNKPLILYPIETFLNSGVIDTLVIVCNKTNKKKIKQLLLPYSDRTIQLIFMCVKVIKENDIWYTLQM